MKRLFKPIEKGAPFSAEFTKSKRLCKVRLHVGSHFASRAPAGPMAFARAVCLGLLAWPSVSKMVIKQSAEFENSSCGGQVTHVDYYPADDCQPMGTFSQTMTCNSSGVLLTTFSDMECETAESSEYITFHSCADDKKFVTCADMDAVSTYIYTACSEFAPSFSTLHVKGCTMDGRTSSSKPPGRIMWAI